MAGSNAKLASDRAELSAVQLCQAFAMLLRKNACVGCTSETAVATWGTQDLARPGCGTVCVSDLLCRQ